MIHSQFQHYIDHSHCLNVTLACNRVIERRKQSIDELPLIISRVQTALSGLMGIIAFTHPSIKTTLILTKASKPVVKALCNPYTSVLS